MGICTIGYVVCILLVTIAKIIMQNFWKGKICNKTINFTKHLYIIKILTQAFFKKTL